MRSWVGHSDMAHMAAGGWRCGVCGHKRGRLRGICNWVGHSNVARVAVGGTVMQHVWPREGAATWCAQLGGAQQHGMCGCKKGGNVMRTPGRGAVTWHVQP
jgi:hypothetical protein